MANSPSPLPKFDAPPVVETVIGIHFDQLPGFDVAQRAIFWTLVRDEFPALEEKPPVEEVREEFGEELTSGGVQIRWQVSESPVSPRLWAKSADGRHTIQLQQDALLVNWERDPATPSKNYWPYEERRKDLESKLRLLDRFLRDAGIGEVRPTSCFATYINHVVYESEEEFPALLERTLTVWNDETSDGWLPPIERCTLQLTYPFPQHQGRLHVNVAPGVRVKDKKRILRIDFSARGVPQEPTIASALDWVDVGHEWIVRGFASLTTAEMHSRWRRTQ